VCVVLASVSILTSCYHVGGRADTLPRGIHTIAIPAFGSLSTRYRLIDTLPEVLGREINSRTRFTAVTDPKDADAILTGNVLSAGVTPTVYDPFSGKATTVQAGVTVSITLTERATGRVLFSRANLGFRQAYSIAVDPHQFFDESSPAFQRLGQDLARDIVSAIVEEF
jgi:hypothetical protein